MAIHNDRVAFDTCVAFALQLATLIGVLPKEIHGIFMLLRGREDSEWWILGHGRGGHVHHLGDL